jgi:DNA repair exonuclease SbcCD ATPase subunit
MITFGMLSLTDFRVIKSAIVPLANQGLVLIRAVNEDTLAADSNGSGKTTIFHGFGWVLFGKLVGEERPVDIIRRGAKSAIAELDWQEGGTEYRVRRVQKRSSQLLELFVDGVPETGRTRADTQERIHELLGLDFDSFRNTVMYGQGDFKRFASPHVTDADRKKVVKRALSLTPLDKALKLLRAELKECREREHETATLLRSARTAHSRAQVDEHAAQEEHEGWQDDQSETLAQLRDDVESVESARAALIEQAGKVDHLEDLERQVQARLGKRPEVEEEARALAALAAPLQGQLDEAEAGRAVLASKSRSARRDGEEADRNAKRERHAASDIRDDARSIAEMDICPTCRTPTEDSTHTQAHLEQLEASACKHDTLAESHEGEATHFYEAEEAHDDDMAVFAQRKLTLREELSAHEAKHTAIEVKLRNIDKWRPKLAKLQRSLREAREAAHALAGLDGMLQAARDALGKAEVETNPHGPALDRAGAATALTNADVDARDSEMRAIEAEMVPLRFWETGFSNKGLPSLALDAVLPIVTESANRYLEVLSDGDIQVDIQPQRTLKAGGMKDEIDISVRIEGHDRVRPSGAQEAKISIAIDLALMDLVATREGASLDVLMLDECLDGLDHEGKRRVFQLLEHLRTSRSTILFVTHDDEIKERFETVWTVTKSGKSATLETE